RGVPRPGQLNEPFAGYRAQHRAGGAGRRGGLGHQQLGEAIVGTGLLDHLAQPVERPRRACRSASQPGAGSRLLLNVRHGIPRFVLAPDDPVTRPDPPGRAAPSALYQTLDITYRKNMNTTSSLAPARLVIAPPPARLRPSGLPADGPGPVPGRVGCAGMTRLRVVVVPALLTAVLALAGTGCGGQATAAS